MAERFVNTYSWLLKKPLIIKNLLNLLNDNNGLNKFSKQLLFFDKLKKFKIDLKKNVRKDKKKKINKIQKFYTYLSCNLKKSNKLQKYLKKCILCWLNKKSTKKKFFNLNKKSIKKKIITLNKKSIKKNFFLLPLWKRYWSCTLLTFKLNNEKIVIPILKFYDTFKYFY